MLSDPTDKLLQELCDPKHLLFCERCEDLKQVISDIEEAIQKNSSNFFSCEQRDDLLYDLKCAKENIFKWKCHILRSCNQEMAKQKVLSSLDKSSALIVIDWAMKFQELSHRETNGRGKRIKCNQVYRSRMAKMICVSVEMKTTRDNWFTHKEGLTSSLFLILFLLEKNRYATCTWIYE